MNTMRYFFFILIIFCHSCKQESPQPEISDEKMAHIMAEIAIAEGATTMLSGFKKDSLANAYYRNIFEMNGITRDDYEKSLRVLVNDVDHTQAVIDQASKIINEKKEMVSDTTDKKATQ